MGRTDTHISKTERVFDANNRGGAIGDGRRAECQRVVLQFEAGRPRERLVRHRPVNKHSEPAKNRHYGRTRLPSAACAIREQQEA